MPDKTQISTCDTVTVNITNGQKPYIVSVIPDIVGAVPENFTLGKDDDAFTFVNRIPTGNSFISEFMTSFRTPMVLTAHLSSDRCRFVST